MVVLCPAARGETRRALLVGIGKYLPRPGTPAPPFQPTALRSKPVEGRSNRTYIPDLKGPPNDVAGMRRLLVERYGFKDDPGEIRVLLNEQATADAILKTLDSFLIQGAAPGDVRIFYFGGHGARIWNTATREMDQAIVPADALAGAPDIRSKELRRWFARMPEGVKFAFLEDSCFSGGGARGEAIYRSVDEDGRTVEDPSPGETLPPTPEARGMLVVSASQADERAMDVEIDGAYHGLFTWALVDVLWANPTESIERVLARVRNLMAGVPGAAQEPSGGGRLAKDLLGRDPDPRPAADALVRKVEAGRLLLSGGTVNSLFPGARLKRMGPGAASEITIVRAGLYDAEAEPAPNSTIAGVKLNDEFQLTRWAAPKGVLLGVYMPPPLEREAIVEATRRFRALPATDGDPTHVLSWRGDGWVLQGPRGLEVALGRTPTAEEVAARLPHEGTVRLRVVLPPTPDLAAELARKLAGNFQVLDGDREGAQYRLEGRLDASGELEYAWVLPQQPEKTLSPYPAQSGWARQADPLAESALQLGRIHTWLAMPSPGKILFPYHLVLVDVTDMDHPVDIEPGGELKADHLIRFDLQAGDAAALSEYLDAGAPPTYIYVFLLDHKGESTLFYPVDDQAGKEGTKPRLGGDRARFTLPRTVKGSDASSLCGKHEQEYDLCIGSPYGTDTYFLLASSTLLPHAKAALAWKPVWTREGSRGEGETALEAHLGTAGSPQQRSLVTPVDWKVEWTAYRSVDAK